MFFWISRNGERLSSEEKEAGFGDVEHLHQRQVGPSLVPLQALDDLVVHGEGLADEAPIAVGDQEFLTEAEQVGALDLHLVVRRKAREDGLAQHHVLLADGNLAVLVELVGPVEEVAHHDDGRCLEGLGQIRGGSVAGRLAGRTWTDCRRLRVGAIVAASADKPSCPNGAVDVPAWRRDPSRGNQNRK
ncbi:hypothetical protein P4234_09115 [Pseudomonas aeruginosa]|nr:hypothetical protein [Pseudomonas aeruginosa]